MYSEYGTGRVLPPRSHQYFWFFQMSGPVRLRVRCNWARGVEPFMFATACLHHGCMPYMCVDLHLVHLMQVLGL